MIIIEWMVNTYARLRGYTFNVRRVSQGTVTIFTDLTFTQADDKFHELAKACSWDSLEIIQERKGKSKVVQSVKF